jgi:predicted dehydrogenase
MAPDPAINYQRGGELLFELGAYCLIVLVALLGPVRGVTGSAHATLAKGVIRGQPRAGQTIVVKVSTHDAAALDFVSGAIGALVTSFDVWAADVPRLAIYGATGALILPDPNTLGGPVRLRRAGEEESRETDQLPLPVNTRDLGVADLAAALRADRPHRASGNLVYHVREIMDAVEEASRDGRHITLTSACDRRAPLATLLTPAGPLHWPATRSERAVAGRVRQ